MRFNHTAIALSFTAAILASSPRPAHAIPGEDWISGQNQLLVELLVSQLEEVTQISTLITNVRYMVQSANEALALARTVKRVYEMLKNYSLEDLLRDAKVGLYRAIPEMQNAEDQVRELVENGKAIDMKNGSFWNIVTTNDHHVSAAVQKTYEHGFQTTIWPHLFPEAMKFKKKPTEVEKMIQERYIRTRDEKRRAVQRTAMSILSKKAEAYVADAEAKDNVDLKAVAFNSQVNFQAMQNLTELRNLFEQEYAIKEAELKINKRVTNDMAKALGANQSILISPPPLPEF